MAKDTITGIIIRLRLHIIVNKEKTVFFSKTLAVIDKYWLGMRFYKRFYQIDEAIGSNRFFRYVGIIMKRYKSPGQIIAVWAINYFTAHKIFNAHIGVAFNGYKHHITHNFEKLLKKKDGSVNTSMIITPISVKIEIYIWSTEFLDRSTLNVVFSPDKKIQKRSV